MPNSENCSSSTRRRDKEKNSSITSDPPCWRKFPRCCCMNTSALLPPPPPCRSGCGGGGGGRGPFTPNANLGGLGRNFCEAGASSATPDSTTVGRIAEGTDSPAAGAAARKGPAEDPPNVNLKSGVFGPQLDAGDPDAGEGMPSRAAAASARLNAAATVAAAAAAAAASATGDGDVAGAGIAAPPLVPAWLFGCEFQRPPAGCRAIDARPIAVRPSGVKYADAVEEVAEEGGDI